MKIFPADKLVIIRSGMEARLEFNPYAKIPPYLWFSIGIECQGIVPGTENLFMILDGIILPERNWKKLLGEYRAPKRWDRGSVCLDSSHNPVDVYAITFRNRHENNFEIDVEGYIDFAFEGADYENTSINLSFRTSYTGIIFHEPTWSDPETVRFPLEWNIPSEFTEESVDELVSRFVDLDGYQRTREGRTFRYEPLVT